ncbi:FCD domain-containing protein [Rhizobium lusitanum]|uniref:FCD domain-containing protein n=1 Tax=Rhizobium lusitanum TaxID=293958 RepID=A0A6L9UCQ9_9HYPH|nr:GntR family transcriptional regulator [Rhizobium lusitanum]NEI73663.1 FCD domain-containing protein [Rhizobium lusitanum]
MPRNKGAELLPETAPDGSAVRTAEAIYRILRLDIAFGRLMPRQRLVESELCERFGTSNHNIRQSFELLDRAGLIERKANRGVEVRALSAAELKDLYDIRVMLQTEGARRIDLSRAEELANILAEINSAYEKALDAEDFEAAAEANDRFHLAMFDCCLNAELAELQRAYWLRASAFISRALSDTNLSRVSRIEHQKIISAIREGDVDRLVEVTVAHIRPALDVYKRLYGII